MLLYTLIPIYQLFSFCFITKSVYIYIWIRYKNNMVGGLGGGSLAIQHVIL